MEKIYQLMSDCPVGNKRGYIYNHGSDMAIVMFLTGRVSEAEALMEQLLDDLMKTKFSEEHKQGRGAVYNHLLKLFRTKDARSIMFDTPLGAGTNFARRFDCMCGGAPDAGLPEVRRGIEHGYGAELYDVGALCVVHVLREKQ